MLRIYLTNLGKYNDGELIGKWIDLPISNEELTEVKQEIGLNKFYEEYFITDFDCDIQGFMVNEYDTVSELNSIAETLEDLSEQETETISALLEDGYSIDEAIRMVDDVMFFYDCQDMEDVAYQYCEECGILDNIPDHLRNYFDYEAYGRDMGFEGHFIFTANGNCIEVMY